MLERKRQTVIDSGDLDQVLYLCVVPSQNLVHIALLNAILRPLFVVLQFAIIRLFAGLLLDLSNEPVVVVTIRVPDHVVQDDQLLEFELKFFGCLFIQSDLFQFLKELGRVDVALDEQLKRADLLRSSESLSC